MAYEQSRADLYSLLRRDLAEETATALMEALPPLDWSDLARRSDLALLRAELKGDFAGLEGRFADLKGEFADLKGAVADLRVEIADLRAKVDSQVPKMILANIPLAFGVAGLVLAAVKL
jgi:hypothetical protein